ncbi:MAG: cobG [Actinomycetia bacterium]|nr:cobG [Actinomycetes bacterium]
MPPTSHAAASEGHKAPHSERAVVDRCPGVLRLIQAADGHLARVRLPGGFITAEQLRLLARLAGEMGDGRVELTSRGNVQLRALAAGAGAPLTDDLTRAGLLPSLDHDRVRNVLASPLAGLDGGPGGDSGTDLSPVVRALDAGLCARPRLAELSGRFLFAIDDGRGDVAGLGADVVAIVRPDGACVNGLAVDAPTVGGPTVRGLAVGGLAVSRSAARGAGPAAGLSSCGDDRADAIATVMLAFAEAFLDERAATASGDGPAHGGRAHEGRAWRIADLPGGAGRVRAIVAERLGLAPAALSGTSAAPALAASVTRPVGIVAGPAGADGGERDRSVLDGGAPAVVLLAPLGRLTVAQVGWLADHAGGRAARVTPWRSVVLPDQADAAEVLREAAGLGFGVDASSPWLRVTACAGQPGCARALADVQADALSLAARWPGRTVHVSGCARHCGRPAATEVDVTATSEGYQVAGA